VNRRIIPILPVLASGLAVLAAAMPWALGFAGSQAAVAGGIAFAMAFAPLAMMITALRPAALVCLAGGVWLAASPWLLDYASRGTAAWSADLLAGGALAALSWEARRGASPAVAPTLAAPPATAAAAPRDQRAA
jgi:hypothetical protein